MSTRSADTVCAWPDLSRKATVAPSASFCTDSTLASSKNLDAALAESLLEFGGDLFVLERHHAREHFQNGDLGPERLKNRGEFHADRAGSHDDQRFRHLWQAENFAVAENHFAVEFHARQRARLRAGGEHDVGGLDFRDLAVGLDRHASGAGPASPASHGLHFVFAEEKLDALGVPVDDAVLARQRRWPIQFEFGDVDAKFFGVFERVVDFRVVQQDLGGDATDVKTGPSEETVLFDDQSLQAPLRGADGGHVTAGSAADDSQIVRWQEQPPRHAAAGIESQENRTSDAAGLPGRVGLMQHNEM